MTVKQAQLLLGCLNLDYPGRGLDPGAADGIPGPRTQKALAAFQRASGLRDDGKLCQDTALALRRAVCSGLEAETDWWQGIRHFTREEFRCKCGGRYCLGFPQEPRRAMVEIADDARAHFGKPGYVISGLRCQEHNSAVGGVENSQHIWGEACDLQIEGIPAETLLGYLQSRPGVRYAYQINDTNVHFDIPKGER